MMLTMVIASAVCFAACSSEPDGEEAAGTETEESADAEGEEDADAPDEGAAETEDADMSPEMVTQLAELLGCPERTAQGFCDIIDKAVEEEVTGITQIEDPYDRVLEITGKSGSKYYAIIEPGWFLSRVTADSLEGECLFMAIQ